MAKINSRHLSLSSTMAKFYDEIPEWLFEWIQKQQMFWVASAPLSQGHINVSPKGTENSFHVVNSKQVWYEDLTGSGIETISHIRENGRITIMFSAFEGPPRILRLFGVGTVHEYGTPEYNALIPAETCKPGSRAVIVVDVYQVGTSCGYAVPLYNFVTHRTQLLRFLGKMEDNDRSLAASNGPSCDPNLQKGKGAVPYRSLRGYWLLKNMRSLDGLPGLLTAPDIASSLIPQSRFDKHTRPTMRQTKGGVDCSQGFRFGDRIGFASGFMSGAVATLAFAAVLGNLKW
ncbi:hypothetical protein HD554DRAFT_818744 [Boletus coccyginus]|nr:hypothetical protein HD554DRAFT_818744 [Boletus coccyginus]